MSDGVQLSVVVASLSGHVPESVSRAVAKHADDVELVLVSGVSPVGRARNEGLARAKGGFIAWVDDDDDVAGDWLDEILKATKAPDVDVVVFGHAWVVSDEDRRVKIWKGTDLLADVFAERKMNSILCDKVTRRMLWDGVRFDETALTSEDWDVLPHVLVRARRVARIDKVLYFYLCRPGSLTTTRSPQMKEAHLKHSLARMKLRDDPTFAAYRREIVQGVANAMSENPHGAPWLRRNILLWLTSGASLRRLAKFAVRMVRPKAE
jgi:glycosyltransferase involved in cell wall biosynthesis